MLSFRRYDVGSCRENSVTCSFFARPCSVFFRHWRRLKVNDVALKESLCKRKHYRYKGPFLILMRD